MYSVFYHIYRNVFYKDLEQKYVMLLIFNQVQFFYNYYNFYGRLKNVHEL